MGAYEFQGGGAGTILYVKASAPAGGDGTSWDRAFKYLQDALAKAGTCFSPTQVWVAAGTYYPDISSIVNSNDYMASFVLNNNVALYGGFAGTETELSQRNWETNRCILSGDVDQTADNAHNSLHVVRSTGVDSSAVLGGFIITGGHASGTDLYGEGAGMYNDGASPTITNCFFVENTAAFVGGGLYNKNSAPVMTACTFVQNTADISGGGIYNESSSPILTNCSFDGNIATHYGAGGGIENTASSPVITSCRFSGNQALRGGGISNHQNSAPVVTHCSFRGNTAISEGGAMYNDHSSPTVTNGSFYGNTAPTGGGLSNYYASPHLVNCSLAQNTSDQAGGIYNNAASPTITNSIVWGNAGGQIYNNTLYSKPVVSYSIVQGGPTDNHNLNQDPMFVSPLGGDLHLKGCSPAINSATATGAPAVDIEGKTRPALGGYDMGAYEFQGGGAGTILYVKASAPAGGDGTSWDRAFKYLQDALAKAGTCFSPTQVWVAAGTYYPDEGGGLANNDRAASFTLKNNVALYGGFAGTETRFGQRNWKSNATILSGDIDPEAGAADNSGNAYHVVRADNLDSSAVLDGFTITGGNANGTGAYPENSDMGGGILINNAAPTITHCIIRSNHALSYGGGVGNLYTYDLVLTNCLFYDNSAKWGGAIAHDDYATSGVINCSFSGNTAEKGGAIYSMNASPRVANSILWGNTGGQIVSARGANVTYSIVQDGYYPDAGNLQADPLFVYADSGDLRLQSCSPAIDAANKALITAATDLDGQPRTVVLQTDMGAYEFQGTVIYVKQGATGRANGTSWDNAYTRLQDALAQPTGCSRLVTIWVAQGTYYPDEGGGQVNNSRLATFQLKNNTAILGGFAGTERVLTERVPSTVQHFQTILSGEVDGVSGTAGNAYHVVSAANVNASAVLDGFTITGGNANGSTAPNNQGGGLYNTASPTLGFCTFYGNNATNGGAVYNAGTATLVSCIFNQNRAAYGGGLYNAATTPTIINGLFWKNTATSQGGAIYNTAASPQVINSSFSTNTAPSGYGGAIRNVSASGPILTNTILWGDTGGEISNASSTPQVTYSIVQGGNGGTGNKNADPLYRDVTTGNLELKNGSPAIDAGNDDALPADITYDLDGWTRKLGAHVDMGAYEWSTATLEPGPFNPLTLTCPADFTLHSDAGSCGAVVDYSGDRAATAEGGKPPVTLTYDPAPGTLLPPGETFVTVTATDAAGESASCNFWVTVLDVTPPVISCPAVAGASVLQGQPLIKATDPGVCSYTIKGAELDVQATDNCPDPLSYSYTFSGATNTTEPVMSSTLSGVVLNQGRTTITWMVQDAAGNPSSCSFEVLVIDKTAPVISDVSTTPSTLYPPNHQLQDITVSYEATDNCEVASTALSVTSNEAPNALGSGNTSSDWQVVDNHHLKLRAERSGKGSGRVYTITITAKDAAGNESHASTTVTVPHDMRAPVTASEAINSKEVDHLKATAVPNPSSDGFTLTTQSPSVLPISIKVIDAAGRVIEQKDRIAANGTLYIGSQYRPGVYYLQIEQGSVRQTIKLIKQSH